jgi:uncharacterized protein
MRFYRIFSTFKYKIRLVMKKCLAVTYLLITVKFVFAQKQVTTFHDFKKTKKSEVYQVNANGIKNGTYISYTEDGAVRSQGVYKNDVKVGKWIYHNGSSTDIETFNNNGEKDGLWIKFCRFNSKLKAEEGTYKADKKNGLWTDYYCTAESKIEKVRSKETYSMGEVKGKCILFDEDGNKDEGVIEGIQRVGEWKSFYPSGHLHRLIKYTSVDKWTSNVAETVYYHSGKIKSTRSGTDIFIYTGTGPTIKRTAMSGTEIFYDSTGVITAKDIWKDDTHGTHEEYFENGKLLATCDVILDSGTGETLYCGHEIRYYANGNKKYECDVDKRGNVIQGTYYGYLETGEPDEKTKILLQNKK